MRILSSLEIKVLVTNFKKEITFKGRIVGVKKIKELKSDLEELKKHKPTLELMESLAPNLKEAIEKHRRWLQNNK